jgi:hypothetical protein
MERWNFQKLNLQQPQANIEGRVSSCHQSIDALMTGSSWNRFNARKPQMHAKGLIVIMADG